MSIIQLDYSPYDYQYDVHNNESRFRLLVGGRRVGKSKLAMQELLKSCLSVSDRLAWWVAPTYKDAREIGFEEFMTFAEPLLPVISTIHQSLLRVRFVNGSTLYFKGSDKFDSLRGRGLDFCVLDEAAFCHEDTWKKAIRPALSDKQGRALFTSTPNGRNWYHTQYEYAVHNRSTHWNAWHWPTWKNPLITQEDLDAAKQELSSIDFRQEYGAEFITKAGMVYDDFCESNIIDGFKYDSSVHDIYIGLDFGFASATAVCFMAVDNITGNVTMFDELYVSRKDVEQVTNIITQKLGAWGMKEKLVYCDPAGNADELTSGISPVDYLRGKGHSVVSKGSKIAPGLALVRAYILNASGKRRFFVTKNCEWAIKSFYAYTYKVGALGHTLEEPQKDNVHDHMMDAIRYFFVNRFDHSKWVAQAPDQVSYSTKDQHTAILKKCGKCRRKFISRTPKDQPPHICNECEAKDG